MRSSCAVELEGKPQRDVRVSFAAPIHAAREVNGQEQPVSNATIERGELVTSLSAFRPRTFALKIQGPATKVASVHSTPVELHYEVAIASADGTASTQGFDSKGNALPAEMLPPQIRFNDVQFQLAPAGSANAIIAKGQSINLPAGAYNRLYVLAASADSDQKAIFEVANKKIELNIEDWRGFIGQWDDREWSSKDTSNDDYGDMLSLKPPYIKRADLAWYCSHHHDAAGKNVDYRYSYLFAYALDLPPGAKTLRLPNNNKIRILAISVAEENATAIPAQPLYDVLPSPSAGAPDFTLSASSKSVSVSQGRSSTVRVLVMPRGGFSSTANLTASGLPTGVTASFNPTATNGSSTVTFTASSSAPPATATVTITAAAAGQSHSVTTEVGVNPVLSGTVPVDLSSSYNRTGIYDDGTKFTPANSLDGDGFAFSAQLLGREQIGDGVVFKLGQANAVDMVTGKTLTLPSGRFSSVKILATAVNGNQELQTFTVTYDDGTSSSFTRSLSDWAAPQHFTGESDAFAIPYRLTSDGSKDTRSFYGYAYSLELDSSKAVRSLSLPSNREVIVLAVTLVPAASN